jgi:exosome complex exonuclease DIS3/RRP44
MIQFDDWPSNSKYPSGHFLSLIGEMGDLNTESEIILLTHQIPHDDFPPSVLEDLPSDDYKIPDSEFERRKDLRGKYVCSIDPPGCRDIDDALHFEQISETECEVGIHIADISFFVREDSPLDFEARERGTTFYLVEKRINMLPPKLSENLCPLMAGV